VCEDMFGSLTSSRWVVPGRPVIRHHQIRENKKQGSFTKMQIITFLTTYLFINAIGVDVTLGNWICGGKTHTHEHKK
jgi:hypothetical protein